VTRLFYASDIHGSEQLWRKFLNAGSFYNAQVLVMGGDMSGKLMVPIVQTAPGRWEARLFGRDQTVKGEESLEELERRARFNGFYPYRCDPEELGRLQEDAAYRDEVFRRAMTWPARSWAPPGPTCT
jgi:Icc-related predicted phosphoesterase